MNLHSGCARMSVCLRRIFMSKAIQLMLTSCQPILYSPEENCMFRAVSVVRHRSAASIPNIILKLYRELKLIRFHIQAVDQIHNLNYLQFFNYRSNRCLAIFSEKFQENLYSKTFQSIWKSEPAFGKSWHNTEKLVQSCFWTCQYPVYLQ